MTDQIVHATFGAVELRVPDESERIVEGIVVPWGETSFLTPDPKGERFRPGSLSRTIAEKGDRVKLFRSHNHERAVGRAVAWKPDHEAGCWAQFRVGTGADGDDLLAEVADGLLDAFSVGFQPIRTQRGADGAREILEARLHEVSIAPIGAYDGARVLAMRTPTTVRVELPPTPDIDWSPLPTLVH